MGLCKCPKKKVTNQFCFEHRVNVCEHCIVSNHSRCIVQSYLQWLEDSDYDPVCHLCKQNLAVGDCIRLVCYHVFHLGCVDAYAQQLPPNTAPAGYTCPVCKQAIFPAGNVMSPVADNLRAVLSKIGWARTGLGLPLMPLDSPDSSVIDCAANTAMHQQTTDASFSSNHQVLESPAMPSIGSSSPEVPKSYSAVPMDGISYTGHADGFDASRSFPAVALYPTRKVYDSTVQDGYRTSSIDPDDNKYKRRSALELFTRWFKSQTSRAGYHRRSSHLLYKRWFVLLLLGLIGLITVVLLFLHWGRAAADSDPLLDPFFNPNIRVENDDESPPRAKTARQMVAKSEMPELNKPKAPDRAAPIQSNGDLRQANIPGDSPR